MTIRLNQKITMMSLQELNVDRNELDDLCQQYHVRRLAIFGSRATGKETPVSDLDLLIEFDEGKSPGLKFFHLQRQLSQLFRVSVDLYTAGFLGPKIYQSVLPSSQVLYAPEG